MKILQIITIMTLTLGLSQMAYADHHGGDDKVCEHKGSMLEADANKDGVISRDEFTAAHQKMADKMFSRMDTNNDGNIDQAERDAMKTNMKAKMDERRKSGEMKHDCNNK